MSCPTTGFTRRLSKQVDGVALGSHICQPRLDVFVRDAGLALEALDLYLVVEVTDIAYDGLVLHPAEVLGVMMSLLPVAVT